jgi:hypothetical protein
MVVTHITVSLAAASAFSFACFAAVGLISRCIVSRNGLEHIAIGTLPVIVWSMVLN